MSARSGLVGKNPPGPIWGHLMPFFPWTGKIQKMLKFCLFFLGGALAAIHPGWGNRYAPNNLLEAHLPRPCPSTPSLQLPLRRAWLGQFLVWEIIDHCFNMKDFTDLLGVTGWRLLLQLGMSFLFFTSIPAHCTKDLKPIMDSSRSKILKSLTQGFQESKNPS